MPNKVLAYTDIEKMIAEMFEKVYMFNFGSSAATWYVCKSCKQRWLHSTVCMGHRDWDHKLQKCDAPEEFFKLAREAMPR